MQVLVITRTGDNGKQEYRLAAAQCKVWNQVGLLKLEPWSAPDRD